MAKVRLNMGKDTFPTQPLLTSSRSRRGKEADFETHLRIRLLTSAATEMTSNYETKENQSLLEEIGDAVVIFVQAGSGRGGKKGEGAETIVCKPCGLEITKNSEGIWVHLGIQLPHPAKPFSRARQTTASRDP